MGITRDEINQIWRYLKSDIVKDTSLSGIVTNTQISPEKVKEFIRIYLQFNKIQYDEESTIVTIPCILAPVPKSRDKVRFYDYKTIRKNMPMEAMGEMAIPRKWMNPAVDYLPDYCDQGQRPTCVGWSVAIALSILHINKLMQEGKELPNPKKARHEVKEKFDDLPCSMMREIYYDIWKSAQFIYYGARKRGNVAYPSGAWLEDAVPFCKEVGAILETDVYTPITSICAPEFYPWEWPSGGSKTREQAYEKAGEFRITGYATTTNFDECCRMIYEQGVCLVGVTIYDNYMKKGCEGIYPFPSGFSDGGHAQVAVGYDLDLGVIYFVQSWKIWSKIGGVNRDYWNYVGYNGERGVDMAYCPIGIDMLETANKVYSKLRITSNVDATFYVDGVKRDEKGSFSIAIEKGTVVTIKAVPPLGTTVETSISRDIMPANPEEIHEFNFTKKKTVYEIIADFFEQMKKLFKRDEFDR